MKLAIIGTGDSLALIRHIIEIYFPSITTYPLTVDKVKNIKNIIQSIPTDMDGIFVSGIGVYFELLKYKLKIPVSYAEHGAISLIKCLEHMRSKNCLKKSVRISFDIMNAEIIEDVAQEFQYDIKDYYIETIHPDKNEEYYITKHLKLFYENKIDYVITSYGYIYSLFKSLDLPVYRMVPSISDLKSNIHALMTEVKLSKLDKSNILVFKFDVLENISTNMMKEQFMKFSKSMDGFVHFSSNKNTILISNKSYYNIDFTMNLLHDFLCENNLEHLRVGIGADISVQKALSNADKALEKKNISNIIFFDGLLYHSFDENKKKLPVNELTTDQILEISNHTGIIPKRIHALNDAIVKRNKNAFTSNDLSQILGLSVRSANRILNALLESGYGILLENETVNGTGRPKRVVKIQFVPPNLSE